MWWKEASISWTKASGSTTPLTFTGKELSINAATSGFGSVYVEICGPDGTPIYENTYQYAILKKEWNKKADAVGDGEQ